MAEETKQSVTINYSALDGEDLISFVSFYFQEDIHG
nr:MAG TPA: hypothetical protein [Caudoviricetes sp.]